MPDPDDALQLNVETSNDATYTVSDDPQPGALAVNYANLDMMSRLTEQDMADLWALDESALDEAEFGTLFGIRGQGSIVRRTLVEGTLTNYYPYLTNYYPYIPDPYAPR